MHTGKFAPAVFLARSPESQVAYGWLRSTFTLVGVGFQRQWPECRGRATGQPRVAQEVAYLIGTTP